MSARTETVDEFRAGKSARTRVEEEDQILKSRLDVIQSCESENSVSVKLS